MRTLRQGRLRLAVAATALFVWLVPACDGTVGEGNRPSEDGGERDGGANPDGGLPDGGQPPDGGTVLPVLHASGHTLVDPAGNVVQLRGVNRSGTEYTCVHGFGIFDGPSDDASLEAIRMWNASAIRIPLNEDCWLGINGVEAAYAGANYQAAIADFADRAAEHGLYPILELHWSAPGTTQADGQNPMPDKDHSVTFWSQVASYFKDRPEFIFELFNEPYPDSNQDTAAAWTCWESGGTCPGVSYTAAGMQELVTAVRDAGAGNLVVLGGVQYSNTLSEWNSHVPTDPLNNLAAAWHVYNYQICNSLSCFDNNIGPTAAAYPVIATEIGEDDCAGGFITAVMGWLEPREQSYLAWTWDAWGGCLVLITDYTGTPNSGYGQTYRTQLQSFPPSP